MTVRIIRTNVMLHPTTAGLKATERARIFVQGQAVETDHFTVDEEHLMPEGEATTPGADGSNDAPEAGGPDDVLEDEDVEIDVAGSTVPQLLKEVDGDPALAAEVLAVEEASAAPRSTLVSTLQEIVNADGV